MANKFPDGFLFGVATSSYQIEGGWDADGKGVNIWDTFTHNHPEMIRDKSNADIACDSYHLYKEDVQNVKELGVDLYRFSISWARILPTGHVNEINQAGIDYYNNLINELIANGIQPMVTMYHWDLPQSLQDLGGWTNPVLAQYFEDYARVLFTNFGDRVKLWNTINEPTGIILGYSVPQNIAPNILTPGHGQYLAMHTLLLSHARAYRLYDREFRETQQGKVSIAVFTSWFQPRTDSKEDEAAAEKARQACVGWVLHPIHKGDYPPLLKDYLAKKSKEEGYYRSRLPEFSKEEIEFVKGTWDFLSLNYYTTFLVSDGINGTGYPVHDLDLEVNFNPEWPLAGSSLWLAVTPWNFRKQLNWVAKEYNNPPIIITENGCPDNGELNDTDRIDFFKRHLKSVLEVIHEDGGHVFGFIAWSLMDNFEWPHGYLDRFGLYHVDFESPKRTRTPKASVNFFKEIVSTKELPDSGPREKFRKKSEDDVHTKSIATIYSAH